MDSVVVQHAIQGISSVTRAGRGGLDPSIAQGFQQFQQPTHCAQTAIKLDGSELQPQCDSAADRHMGASANLDELSDSAVGYQFERHELRRITAYVLLEWRNKWIGYCMGFAGGEWDGNRSRYARWIHGSIANEAAVHFAASVPEAGRALLIASVCGGTRGNEFEWDDLQSELGLRLAGK